MPFTNSKGKNISPYSSFAKSRIKSEMDACKKVQKNDDVKSGSRIDAFKS
jgi:hypothetical protein